MPKKKTGKTASKMVSKAAPKKAVKKAAKKSALSKKSAKKSSAKSAKYVYTWGAGKADGNGSMKALLGGKASNREKTAFAQRKGGSHKKPPRVKQENVEKEFITPKTGRSRAAPRRRAARA